MTNDTQTMTLTEFLSARIAEDEAVARDASNGADRIAGRGEAIGPRWNVVTLHYEGIHVWPRPGGLDKEGGQTLITAHMQRHDPARVLAECEAKRQIVEMYAEFEGVSEEEQDRRWDGADAGMAEALYRVCNAMAAAYADHPDHQQEWAV